MAAFSKDLADRTGVRAIIYARASQDQTGLEESVTRQVEKCRELVDKHSYALVAEPFVDNSVSATALKKRPRWQAALDMLRGRQADVIVAVDLDRLSRHPDDIEELIKIAEDAGGAIQLVSGEIDLTTTDGQLSARILVAVAAAEVRRKGERQRRGNAQRAAQKGTKTKGVTPFGFEHDKVTVNPREAAAIQRGAQALLDGASLSSVGRAWTAAGFTPRMRRTGKDGVKRQTEWTTGGVKALYLNPRYIGTRVYIPKKKGKAVLAERQEFKGAWEPILEEETFYALQAKLKDPSRLVGTGYKRVGKAPATTLLSSLARCGRCDGGWIRAAKSRALFTYTCRKCNGFSVQREFADGMVEAAFIAWAEHHKEPVLTGVGPTGGQGVALEIRRQELISQKGAIEASVSAMKSLGLPATEAESALAQIQRSLDEIAVQMNTNTETALLKGLASAATPASWWQSLPLAQQRSVIEFLMEVRIHPRKNKHGNEPHEIDIRFIR